MTLGGWLAQAEARLKSAGVDTARLDAQILVETVLKKERSWLAAHGQDKLADKDIKILDKMLLRRAKRQPLAYITGVKEFYGLEFKVTPEVLIPRPETESLVEAAVKNAPRGAKVLELGTGSGCVALALKTSRRDLELTATDVSKGALKVATQNAKVHSVDIKFLLSDLFKGVQGRFDLVLANLPYVPEGARRMTELDFEPQSALYGGADGLDYYREFLPELEAHLTEAGQALVEAGPTQRRALKVLGESAGFNFRSLTEYVSLLYLRST